MQNHTPLAERMKHPLQEPKWFAVYTAARQEDAARIGMKRMGYWTWLPVRLVRRTVRRPRSTMTKIVTDESAYFPRYCFVAFRYHGDNFDDLRTVPQVSTVVRSPFTGQPLQFPTSVMEALIARSEDGCGVMERIDLVAKGPRSKLEVGSQIQWKPGALLSDMVATVVSDDGGRDIRVWVEEHGREVKVRAENVVVPTEEAA